MTTNQKYFVHVIVKLLQLMKWNRFSIVYYENKYFTHYKNMILENLKSLKACVNLQIRLSPPIYNDTVFENLYKHSFVEMIENSKKARLVLLFLPKKLNMMVLKIIKLLSPNHNLILLAIDNWPDLDEIVNEGLATTALGTITISEFSRSVTDFSKWMEAFKVDNKLAWVKMIVLGRNYNFPPSLLLSHPINKTQFPGSNLSVPVKKLYDKRFSVILDTVTTLRYAIENMIQTVCSEGDHRMFYKNLIECVNNYSIIPYIQDVSFVGRTGDIKFNKFKSIVKLLRIAQMIRRIDIKSNYVKSDEIFYHNYIYKMVGTYNTFKNQLTIFNPLIWKNYSFVNGETAPLSSCSLPCIRKHIKIPSDVICCWKCAKCIKREAYSLNLTMPCFNCSTFTWPDSNRFKCVGLPIKYLYSLKLMRDLLGVLISFVLLCFVLDMVFHMFYHNIPTFKSEITPLIALKCLGILLGLSTYMYILIKPSNHLCVASQFMLLLSVTINFCLLSAKMLIARVVIEKEIIKLQTSEDIKIPSNFHFTQVPFNLTAIQVILKLF
ncbi:unnamed protein product [Gordionus sp. m RMFG-2023]